MLLSNVIRGLLRKVAMWIADVGFCAIIISAVIALAIVPFAVLGLGLDVVLEQFLIMISPMVLIIILTLQIRFLFPRFYASFAGKCIMSIVWTLFWFNGRFSIYPMFMSLAAISDIFWPLGRIMVFGGFGYWWLFLYIDKRWNRLAWLEKYT